MQGKQQLSQLIFFSIFILFFIITYHFTVLAEEQEQIDDLEQIEMLQNKKDFYLGKIKKIGGYEIFKKLKPLPVDVDNKTLSNIKETAETTYWNYLKEQFHIIQSIQSC